MHAPAANPAADPSVRRSGIGSSDAPIVAGLSPYATPADLFLEKRGLAAREVPEFVREAAEWGQIMEPVILREYARRENVHVIGRDDRGRVTIWEPDGNARPVLNGDNGSYGFRRFGGDGITPVPFAVCQAIAGTPRHPDREWMMFHPDGFALNTAMEPVQLIEAKTASEWVSKEWGEEDTDAVPFPYLVQVQHGAEVTRGLFGYALPIRIPVVMGGNRYRIHRLELDPKLVGDLVAIEEAFWRNVEEGEMPDIEPDARGLETLKRLYPDDAGNERLVPATDPLHQTAVELARVSEELKTLEERKAALNVQIQKAMGETRKLKGDGWSYTWATQNGRVKTGELIKTLAERAGIEQDELERLEDQHRGEPMRVPYPYLRKL